VLLVGPSGRNTILMGHTGGCPGTTDPPSVDVTFDQASLSSVPDPSSGSLPAGTYRPTQNAVDVLPLRPPAPAGPTYPADLNVFNGQPANGTWSLFIDDQVSGDDGQVLQGWSLHLTAAVNTLKAGKPKLNKKKGTARIPVTVGDAGTLTLKGKGVKSASASKAKAVSGPGTVKLTVKPKGQTASKLNSTGSATAKVKITFTPTGGTPKVVKKKVKLKKTLG
jgi:hypothetical protein